MSKCQILYRPLLCPQVEGRHAEGAGRGGRGGVPKPRRGPGRGGRGEVPQPCGGHHKTQRTPLRYITGFIVEATCWL
jgi:hypothetical protein